LGVGPLLGVKVAQVGPVQDVIPTLFYPAALNLLFGDSNAGKSLQMTLVAAQEILSGHHVVWVDYEDRRATIDERLDLMGVSAQTANAHLLYCNPDDPWDEAAAARLRRNLETMRPSLIVVDSFGEALAVESLSEDKDTDVTPFLSLWRRFASSTGAAVVVIDHENKAGGSPLHPSGSKRKKAAVNGAMFRADAGKPFSKEQAGYSTIVCTKDRHGSFSRKEVVAIFSVKPGTDEPFRLATPHDGADADSSEGQRQDNRRHRALVERSVNVLKRQGESVSTKEAHALVRDAGTFKASDRSIGAALDTALRLGCVEKTGGGPGKATTWLYVRDVDSADNDRIDGRWAGAE
jgi:hypothetical protein